MTVKPLTPAERLRELALKHCQFKDTAHYYMRQAERTRVRTRYAQEAALQEAYQVAYSDAANEVERMMA